MENWAKLDGLFIIYKKKGYILFVRQFFFLCDILQLFINRTNNNRILARLKKRV